MGIQANTAVRKRVQNNEKEGYSSKVKTLLHHNLLQTNFQRSPEIAFKNTKNHTCSQLWKGKMFLLGCLSETSSHIKWQDRLTYCRRQQVTVLQWLLFIWSSRYKKVLMERQHRKTPVLIHIPSLFLPLWSPVNLFCEIQQCLSASLTTLLSLEIRSLMQVRLIFTGQDCDREEGRECGEDVSDRRRFSQWEKFKREQVLKLGW